MFWPGFAISEENTKPEKNSGMVSTTQLTIMLIIGDENAIRP